MANIHNRESTMPGDIDWRAASALQAPSNATSTNSNNNSNNNNEEEERRIGGGKVWSEDVQKVVLDIAIKEGNEMISERGDRWSSKNEWYRKIANAYGNHPLSKISHPQGAPRSASYRKHLKDWATRYVNYPEECKFPEECKQLAIIMKHFSSKADLTEGAADTKPSASASELGTPAGQPPNKAPFQQAPGWSSGQDLGAAPSIDTALAGLANGGAHKRGSDWSDSAGTPLAKRGRSERADPLASKGTVPAAAPAPQPPQVHPLIVEFMAKVTNKSAATNERLNSALSRIDLMQIRLTSLESRLNDVMNLLDSQQRSSSRQDDIFM